MGQDLDHIAAGAPMQMLMLDAYGLLDAPTAHWMHILPRTGLRFLLQRAHFGQYLEHWYSSMGWTNSKSWPKYDVATLYMISCSDAKTPSSIFTLDGGMELAETRRTYQR